MSKSDWPAKRDLLGLKISCVEYDEAVGCIVKAAGADRSAIVSCHAVHAVTTISEDDELCHSANQFAMITPDGQPVRWALNWLHGAGLVERVYGPELMQRVIAAAAERGIGIYLYGGTTKVLDKLISRLRGEFPNLVLSGYEAPPFRLLTEPELVEVADRINASGAAITFIGLGCPKQDRFAAQQAKRIRGVQICVGAAFDFNAGEKPMAPKWMQDRGLEWMFRLSCEPGRLWKRYLVTNSKFCYRVFVSKWKEHPRRALELSNRSLS